MKPARQTRPGPGKHWPPVRGWGGAALGHREKEPKEAVQAPLTELVIQGRGQREGPARSGGGTGWPACALERPLLAPDPLENTPCPGDRTCQGAYPSHLGALTGCVSELDVQV